MIEGYQVYFVGMISLLAAVLIRAAVRLVEGLTEAPHLDRERSAAPRPPQRGGGSQISADRPGTGVGTSARDTPELERRLNRG